MTKIDEDARTIAHIHERRSDRGCVCVVEADRDLHSVLCTKLTDDINELIETYDASKAAPVDMDAMQIFREETGPEDCLPPSDDMVERVARTIYPHIAWAYKWDGNTPYEALNEHAIETLAVMARAVLAALNGQTVPEGWVMVPVEPTAAMIIAGRDYLRMALSPASGAWETMLAAAPTEEYDGTQ